MKILSSKGHRYRAAIGIFLIVLAVTTLMAGMVGCGNRPAVNAIEIWDWYGLAAISNNVSADYLLMTNLDSTASGYTELASSTANDGKGWLPIATGTFFGGLFDGQGYEIRDFVINRPDQDFVGLFSLTNIFGVIRNVGVVNATVTGHLYVGGMMGSNWRDVFNCYCRGNVTGYQFVGGLAGHNGNSCNVTSCYGTGNVAGDERVGGLVGNNEGTVGSSYSTSTVTGFRLVGGLVGINFEIIRNCHSTGNVTGSYDVGGLVGVGGSVTNSFWDTETSGQNTSAGGTGKTTAEMRDIVTFLDAGWSIIGVGNLGQRNPSYTWNIVDTVTYPFLSCQPVS
jgi:hypothetical protein